jgi:hypothetical protein
MIERDASAANSEEPPPHPTSTEHLQALTLAIAQNRAVVYVGAGVSASSGLAAWEDLLSKLRELTKPFSKNWDKATKSYFDKLFQKSKNLEAADWLHDILDNDLEQALWEQFGKRIVQEKLGPSPIHKNLARIPFSMAVTTNYDTLLEMAFRGATSLTWRDRQAVLQALRDSRFVVLHAHGLIGNGPSLILTGAQYGHLMHGNPRFGELLRWILTTRTCLFVGAALDDPDLIYQLRQGVTEHGAAFGPHYALVPHDEAPKLRQTILSTNLRVYVIPVTGPLTEPRESPTLNAGCENAPSKSKSPAMSWKTIETSRILRDLSGHVAKRKFELGLPQLPTSDDSLFHLKDALSKLLEQVCDLTGSFRGDFCLPAPAPPHSHRRSSGLLKYLITCGPKDLNVGEWEVTANSICGIAFYKATSEHGVYLFDVKNKSIDPESRLDLFGEIDYKVGHTDVLSELAVPVEANGRRVGVLNLESDLVDGYGSGHIFVAQKFAEKAGRLYAITEERETRGARITNEAICRIYGVVRLLCVGLLRLIKGDHHSDAFSFLVYRANFMTGELRAQDPKLTVFKKWTREGQRVDTSEQPKREGIKTPCFLFPKATAPEPPEKESLAEPEKESLAGKVFREGYPMVYDDAARAFKEELESMYSEALEIEGALIGLPIHIRGHVSGAVVAWFRGGKGTLHGRHVDMFRRLSHLIVNASSEEELEVDHLPEPTKDDLKRPPGIRSAHQIVRFLESSAQVTPSPNPKLNEFGAEVWRHIGEPVHKFLNLVHAQEDAFRAKHKADGMPDYWVHPLRCRCWVRARPLGEDHDSLPPFVLGFETTTIACEGINKLSYNYSPPERAGAKTAQKIAEEMQEERGVAMRPFPRPIQSDGKAARQEGTGSGALAAEGDEESTHENPALKDIRAYGREDHPIPVRLFNNNPHLSFLLSRARTRPFAFVQRPRVLGRDVMARILNKDESSAWFVAPIVVAKEGDWLARSSKEGIFEDRLVAFLTFDQPKSHPLERKEGNSAATSESWTGFQNDLLHELDLFTSGISQREYFQELLKLVRADEANRANAPQ